MRNLFAASILSVLMAGPALATQEYILPTLFDVTDVASDDALNIRAEPNATSQIIGTLAYDAKNIEVVQESKGWARVNAGEASGWVSSRYLSYRTDVWEPGKTPAALRCMGTEPFWNVEIDPDEVRLHDLSQGDQVDVQPVEAVLDTGIFRDPTRAIVAGDFTLMVAPAQCSDGMSDRAFGLKATLIERGSPTRMLNGCCSIQP